MEIKYLTQLQNNPTRDRIFTNESLEISEIEALEGAYNNDSVFPKALRELLFLAGKYCIIFDFGLHDSQQELQEFVRSNLLEEGKSISRPFYVIDIYNAYDQFLFIYLDEGDNPPIYEATYTQLSAMSEYWIRKVQPSLSNLVNLRIQAIKEGMNPF